MDGIFNTVQLPGDLQQFLHFAEVLVDKPIPKTVLDHTDPNPPYGRIWFNIYVTLADSMDFDRQYVSTY